MKLYIRTIEEYDGVDAGLLEEKRRRRLARISSPKVRAECIAAGMLLREALADYGWPVGDRPLELAYGDGGKPYLASFAENAAPGFSLSHSGKLVVCAVDDEDIGVDVQEVRKVSARLPKKVLSDAELAEYQRLLSSGAESEATGYFIVRWTEKESIAKLTGKGLGEDFRSLYTSQYRIHTLFHAVDGVEYIVSTAQYL
ncbi:MAG: 4'-phosphopantetheinyl transferase superfamily protein [Lachnospiraceae bacterium]|nr:4'-phosphopantetheinyl transferase superfamily protein [Lachnospiraceae bacterium]